MVLKTQYWWFTRTIDNKFIDTDMKSTIKKFIIYLFKDRYKLIKFFVLFRRFARNNMQQFVPRSTIFFMFIFIIEVLQLWLYMFFMYFIFARERELMLLLRGLWLFYRIAWELWEGVVEMKTFNSDLISLGLFGLWVKDHGTLCNGELCFFAVLFLQLQLHSLRFYVGKFSLSISGLI